MMSPFPPLSAVQSRIFHGRSGRVSNAFRYDASFVLVDIETIAHAHCPRFFSLERINLWALRSRDYGDGTQTLAERARALRAACFADGAEIAQTLLLTQPACLGFAFNPVSFWLFLDGASQIRAVVAEVNNVLGDRHSYICRHHDHRQILPTDRLSVQKIFHVSPFQPVDGHYLLNFALSHKRITIGIGYHSESDDGLRASIAGEIGPVSSRQMLMAFFRLPFGALRVVWLILWQGLKLKMKGAQFRSRPAPPLQEIS